MSGHNSTLQIGTFLDSESNPSFESSDVCCLGVGIDCTACYAKGARFGPKAVMDASYIIEDGTPVFGKPLISKVKIHSFGILDYAGKELSHEELTKVMAQMVCDVRGFAKQAFSSKKLLMTFGGDHSVPNGVVEEMAAIFKPANVTVLHFDAHLDLRYAYEFQKYSHASIMRNVRELGFPVIQVGPRDHVGEEEAEYLAEKQLGSQIFFCPTMPSQFYKDNLKSHPFINKNNFVHDGRLTDEQIRRICAQINTKCLYITIDCDGIDAKEMPGTGTPLPHGMTLAAVEELLYAVLADCRKKGTKLVGFDICEISPMTRSSESYDSQRVVTPMTEMNAALLAYKILLWNFIDRFV